MTPGRGYPRARCGFRTSDRSNGGRQVGCPCRRCATRAAHRHVRSRRELHPRLATRQRGSDVSAAFCLAKVRIPQTQGMPGASGSGNTTKERGLPHPGAQSTMVLAFRIRLATARRYGRSAPRAWRHTQLSQRRGCNYCGTCPPLEIADPASLASPIEGGSLSSTPSRRRCRWPGREQRGHPVSNAQQDSLRP